MKSLHRIGLASGLLTGLVGTAAHFSTPNSSGLWVASAQAQSAPQPQTEEEKKRQQKQQQQKQNPQQQPPQGRPPQPQQPQARPQQPQTPPQRQVNPQFVPRQLPPGQQPGQPQPVPQAKQVNPQFLPKPGTPGTPPAQQPTVQQQPPGTPGTPGQPQARQVNPQFLPRQGTPGAPGTPPPQPGVQQVTPNPQFKQGPGFMPSAAPTTPAGSSPSTFLPKRLDQVQGSRQQTVVQGKTVITEPGNRTIIKQDNRVIIRSDDRDRFSFGARDVRTTRGPGGTTETFFIRPDGTRVVTVTDSAGRILRRYRVDRGGREVSLIDNRRFYRNAAIGVGVGLLGAAILYNLPRPQVDMPRERYIVDYDRASDDDLYDALTAPPLMRGERAYSLEEIRDNYSLRERMRSVDLDNVTFDSGSFEVTPDQYPMLERIARIINRVLRERPDEIFMIEGHTDATGSPEDNLSLSDRRAQAVAQVLSEQFGVPPENLVTQGYGDQYLKIETSGAERANRRVTVRRISPLMADKASGGQ